MEITISGRHQKVTPVMKKYAHEKAEKLRKYFDRIGQVEVILECEGDGYASEMIVSAKRGKRIVARAADDDMFASIDLMVDKMERQLTKHKEKLKSHRLRANKGDGAAPVGRSEVVADGSLDTDDDSEASEEAGPRETYLY